MTTQLKELRAYLAEKQRRAGISLADIIRMRRKSTDLFSSQLLEQNIDSLLDRIEDLTQQLLDIENQIELCEEEDADTPEPETIEFQDMQTEYSPI